MLLPQIILVLIQNWLGSSRIPSVPQTPAVTRSRSQYFPSMEGSFVSDVDSPSRPSYQVINSTPSVTYYSCGQDAQGASQMFFEWSGKVLPSRTRWMTRSTFVQKCLICEIRLRRLVHSVNRPQMTDRRKPWQIRVRMVTGYALCIVD